MLCLKPQIQQQTPTRYRRYQTADATLETGKLQLFTTSNHPQVVGRGPHRSSGPRRHRDREASVRVCVSVSPRSACGA